MDDVVFALADHVVCSGSTTGTAAPVVYSFSAPRTDSQVVVLVGVLTGPRPALFASVPSLQRIPTAGKDGHLWSSFSVESREGVDLIALHIDPKEARTRLSGDARHAVSQEFKYHIAVYGKQGERTDLVIMGYSDHSEVPLVTGLVKSSSVLAAAPAFFTFQAPPDAGGVYLRSHTEAHVLLGTAETRFEDDDHIAVVKGVLFMDKKAAQYPADGFFRVCVKGRPGIADNFVLVATVWSPVYEGLPVRGNVSPETGVAAFAYSADPEDGELVVNLTSRGGEGGSFNVLGPSFAWCFLASFTLSPWDEHFTPGVYFVEVTSAAGPADRLDSPPFTFELSVERVPVSSDCSVSPPYSPPPREIDLLRYGESLPPSRCSPPPREPNACREEDGGGAVEDDSLVVSPPSFIHDERPNTEASSDTQSDVLTSPIPSLLIPSPGTSDEEGHSPHSAGGESHLASPHQRVTSTSSYGSSFAASSLERLNETAHPGPKLKAGLTLNLQAVYDMQREEDAVPTSENRPPLSPSVQRRSVRGLSNSGTGTSSPLRLTSPRQRSPARGGSGRQRRSGSASIQCSRRRGAMKSPRRNIASSEWKPARRSMSADEAILSHATNSVSHIYGPGFSPRGSLKPTRSPRDLLEEVRVQKSGAKSAREAEGDDASIFKDFFVRRPKKFVERLTSPRQKVRTTGDVVGSFPE